MVDVNDPTGIGKKLRQQWELLDDADIDDADRSAIESFVTWRRGEDIARGTRRLDLIYLRLAAERSDVSLLEMRLGDLERLFRELVTPEAENGYGHDPDDNTMYQYRRVSTLFYRYLDKREHYPAFPWHSEISIPKVEIEGAARRDEMLTGEDLEELKQGTNHPRDRALVAFLADIAGRIGLALSLRVGDVHVEGDEPYFTPNREMPDGLKKLSSSEIPIMHSRADLRVYLAEYHPEPDVDRAPLWPVLGNRYDPEHRRQCALGDRRCREMLEEAAERVGLEKPVNPHNFRRTAATRLSNSDRLTPQEIAQITGWSSETLTEMLDAYDYTSEKERNSQIHQQLGLSDGSSDVGRDIAELELAPVRCGNCRTTFPDNARFCPNCGVGREEADELERRDVERTVQERIDDAESVDEAKLANTLGRFTRDHPDPVVGALKTDDSHD